MRYLKRFIIKGFLLILDILIALSCLIVFYILMTGGGEFYAGDMYIRFYSSRNVLILLIILLPLRFYAGDQTPFFLIKKLHPQQLSQKLLNFWTDFYQKLESLKKEDVIRFLAAIVFISTVIKILNSWFYYGFFSGDDVEVFEMTFAQLFDWKWEAWNLRSAFYPMLFIYPVQALLKGTGVTDPAVFVFAGRLIVIVFSILNIFLVYKIVSRLFENPAPGLLAAFILAFSQLHISFAASVLPRTVSSSFILCSLYLLILKPKSSLFASLAGVAIGIGAVIRFSEAIFIFPCLIYLIMEKRIRHAVLVSLTSSMTGIALLGISDYYYWGSPFFSLKNIIDYTLVKKLSSRSYQSPLYYIIHIGEWSNGLMIVLTILASRYKKHIITIWALIPLLILSIFPHKESRYLVPVIPFFAAMAGIGLWYWVKQTAENLRLQLPKRQMQALLLSFVFMGSLLFEIDGFRFRRSEAGVDVAKYLSKQKNIQSAAFEQIWRGGGKIYLHKIPHVLDISPDSIGDTRYLMKIINTPGLKIVVLKENDVKKYHYDTLLIKEGFEEFHVRQKGRDRYRLFKKRVAPAPHSRSAR
jgi:hypothetical protein